MLRALGDDVCLVGGSGVWGCVRILGGLRVRMGCIQLNTATADSWSLPLRVAFSG